MQLRPYQITAIQRLRRNIKTGCRAQILCAPTGSGKTVIAAQIISRAVQRDSHVLFVTHRTELIRQTGEKLSDFGVPHGYIKAGFERGIETAPVQVAGIQTLVRRKMLPPADLIFFDEAHLSMAKSWQVIADYYDKACLVGMTATPTRLDGKGLGNRYQEIVQVASIYELVEQGYLVKPRVFAVPFMDLKQVRIQRGDYDAKQLEDLVNQSVIVGDIVKHWLKHAKDRMTIVFAVGIKHSRHLCACFCEQGIKAEHADGSMNKNDRAVLIDRWRAGEFQVLCNANLFIEGLDVPEIGCCVLARPSKSLTIYLQSVGRCMRPAPGKPDAIILDHAGHTHRHGHVLVERDWQLEVSKDKKAHQRLPGKWEQCKYCFAYFALEQGTTHCPECGALLDKKKPRKLNQEEGDLEEITDVKKAREAWRQQREKAQRRRELGQAQTLAQLIELGKQRGYRYPKGWAKHVMAARSQYRR